MRLRDALRTTAAVREFSDEPVSDEVVYAILDTARFSPSGGNRQGWRVVLIRDCQLRRALRDLYRPAWREYLAQAKAGLVAWAPITDRERERQAIAEAAAGPALTEAERAGFVENLDRVPVLLVLLADLRTLAATDRDHDRYTFVGGASMYPFAWSILLAARSISRAGCAARPWRHSPPSTISTGYHSPRTVKPRRSASRRPGTPAADSGRSVGFLMWRWAYRERRSRDAVVQHLVGAQAGAADADRPGADRRRMLDAASGGCRVGVWRAGLTRGSDGATR